MCGSNRTKYPEHQQQDEQHKQQQSPTPCPTEWIKLAKPNWVVAPPGSDPTSNTNITNCLPLVSTQGPSSSHSNQRSISSGQTLLVKIDRYLERSLDESTKTETTTPTKQQQYCGRPKCHWLYALSRCLGRFGNGAISTSAGDSVIFSQVLQPSQRDPLFSFRFRFSIYFHPTISPRPFAPPPPPSSSSSNHQYHNWPTSPDIRTLIMKCWRIIHRWHHPPVVGSGGQY